MTEAVVDYMLVDFISDYIRSMLLTKTGDDLQLLPGKHLSRWVGRGVQDQGFGVLVKGFFQCLKIYGPAWLVQGNEEGSRPAEGQTREVVFIIRFENDNLLSGVDEGQQR